MNKGADGKKLKSWGCVIIRVCSFARNEIRWQRLGYKKVGFCFEETDRVRHMYFRSNERAKSELVAREVRPAAAMIQSLRFQLGLLLGLWAIPLWFHLDLAIGLWV